MRKIFLVLVMLLLIPVKLNNVESLSDNENKLNENVLVDEKVVNKKGYFENISIEYLYLYPYSKLDNNSKKKIVNRLCE